MYFILFILIGILSESHGADCVDQKSQLSFGRLYYLGIEETSPGEFKFNEEVKKDYGLALEYLNRASSKKEHGEPHELNFSLFVEALNLLGSYFETQKNDLEKAKEFYERSRDIFVHFGGMREECIANRNLMRIATLGE
jgi:hypothetical protein